MSRRSSLARKPAKRDPAKKFVLYSEGKNTEPAYFRAFEASLPGALIELEIIKAVGVPVTIAEAAAKRKKSKTALQPGDEVWAVFDRDAHPAFDRAIATCHDNGVGLAISNPCFELWLILHSEEFGRPDDRHQIQAHFQKLCPEYDPKGGKTPDCKVLVADVLAAERRAEAQRSERAKDGADHPMTTVDLLTKAMRAASLAFKGK